MNRESNWNNPRQFHGNIDFPTHQDTGMKGRFLALAKPVNSARSHPDHPDAQTGHPNGIGGSRGDSVQSSKRTLRSRPRGLEDAHGTEAVGEVPISHEVKPVGGK